ncbi:MAG: hypothetical protein ABI221_03420 [Candidatus Saccharimonadales bacterium]
MPPAAAATIERPAINLDYLEQEYAHSMETIRRMGAVALPGLVEIAEVGSERLAYDDFKTSVIEMIKTDAEFKDKLQVESRHEYAIINGQACNANGEPIVELVQKGLNLSLHKAVADSRMAIQAGRDEVDLSIIQAVDAMPVGTTLHGLSMEPKAELEADSKFWKKLGYREGVAYWQSYSKISETTLETAVLTIDLSDTDVWRQIFAEEGVVVPEDESPNNWLSHAIEKQQTPQEALRYVRRLRQRYYQKVGSTSQRFSVTEFVGNHQTTIDTIFKSYYPHVAQALHSGDNNPTIQQFAADLLTVGDDLKPEVRQGLIRLANKSRFDDADGRLMDSFLRYAAVEELRKALPAFVSQDSLESGVEPSARTTAHRPVAYGQFMPALIPPAQLNRMLSRNVQSGVRAGRTYGGCAQQISLGRKKDGLDAGLDELDPLNPQEEFGGRGRGDDQEDGETSTGAACEYVHDGCYCCDYGIDGHRLPFKMQVRARRDKNGTAYCLRAGCNASLDKYGKGSKGDIYRKAQALERVKYQPVSSLAEKRKQKLAEVAYNNAEQEEALAA